MVMPMFERTFPAVPLAGLGRSNKFVFIGYIHDALVLADIRFQQERLATPVDGDCLEIAESIASEIDRGRFYLPTTFLTWPSFS
jgi:hypothetical protein